MDQTFELADEGNGRFEIDGDEVLVGDLVEVRLAEQWFLCRMVGRPSGDKLLHIVGIVPRQGLEVCDLKATRARWPQ